MAMSVWRMLWFERKKKNRLKSFYTVCSGRERETDRQTDTETERERHTHTQRQRDSRETDR